MLNTQTQQESANSSPTVKASKLDKHIATLNDKLESGAADSQVNRVISNGILKTLHKIRGNEDLFDSEGVKAIAGLREAGLDAHADILVEYISGRTDMREARGALRGVEITPVEKVADVEPFVPEATYTYTQVSVEEGIAEFQNAIQEVKPMVEEIMAITSAMQESITPELINVALEQQGIDPDSLTDEERQVYIDNVRDAISGAARDANDNIGAALSPDNVRTMVQDAVSGIPAMKADLAAQMLSNQFKAAVEGGAPPEQVKEACLEVQANPAYSGLDCSSLGAAP